MAMTIDQVCEQINQFDAEQRRQLIDRLVSETDPLPAVAGSFRDELDRRSDALDNDPARGISRETWSKKMVIKRQQDYETGH